MRASGASYKLSGFTDYFLFLSISIIVVFLGVLFLYGGILNKKWFVYPETNDLASVLLGQNISIRNFFGEMGVCVIGIIVGGSMVIIPILVFFKIR